MSNNLFFRQGDVGLKATALPNGSTRKEVKGRLVLAWGEVTGHAHAFDVATVEAGNVECYEKDGKTYLRVVNPSDLKHEEHAPHTIPPGDYEVFIQREYTPEAIRNVLD